MIEYNFSDILRYFKANPLAVMPHTFTSNGKSIQKLTLGITSFPVAPRWNLLKRTPATMYTKSTHPKLKKNKKQEKKSWNGLNLQKPNSWLHSKAREVPKTGVYSFPEFFFFNSWSENSMIICLKVLQVNK